MITESHLNVVRKVLEGEMTHAQLVSNEWPNSALNNQHRATVAVTMLLIHAEQCCWSDSKNSWVLRRPGLEKRLPPCSEALNAKLC